MNCSNMSFQLHFSIAMILQRNQMNSPLQYLHEQGFSSVCILSFLALGTQQICEIPYCYHFCSGIIIVTILKYSFLSESLMLQILLNNTCDLLPYNIFFDAFHKKGILKHMKKHEGKKPHVNFLRRTFVTQFTFQCFLFVMCSHVTAFLRKTFFANCTLKCLFEKNFCHTIHISMLSSRHVFSCNCLMD